MWKPVSSIKRPTTKRFSDSTRMTKQLARALYFILEVRPCSPRRYHGKSHQSRYSFFSARFSDFFKQRYTGTIFALWTFNSGKCVFSFNCLLPQNLALTYTAETSCSPYPNRLACLKTSLADAVRGRGCSSWSPKFKLNFRSFCMCCRGW